MRLRFPAYPATVMLVAAGLFVVFKDGIEHRLQTFAMLSLTAVGVTELVFAVTSVTRRLESRRDSLGHLLLGTGALAMGYSLVGTPIAVTPFVAGAVVLSAALVDVTRRLMTTRPSA